MKNKIIETLKELRAYALAKGYEISLIYHEEDSHLMRFANSSISLNTNEHLIRIEITAYQGQKRASYELITNLDQLDEIKKGIDIAAQMAVVAQPLNYKPTIPLYTESFADEDCFDPDLAYISNEEKLAFFNQSCHGLESDDIKLSGIFSCGANTLAMINTRSENTQYFKTSDAQITTVLSHARLKWEVIGEQSAQKKGDLNAHAIRNDLAFLVEHYTQDESLQLPLGQYDIVFGHAAIAEMLSFMNYIGFNGGLMKRGFSFLSEESIGKKVFSEKITLEDDPKRAETFPFKRDFMGMVRNAFPIFDRGVFQGFTWFQDDADEFGAKPSGHTVPHLSLHLFGGEQKVETLADLQTLPREKDILYIPFLHYMNIVNPSKGVITGSSRFGALLLKQDGSVAIPYNVRLTQSLLDIFGEKVEWLSKQALPYNTSNSYGSRNPTSIVAPRFMFVRDLEISHSNSSY